MTRRRSLKKDNKDWNQFRFGRDRHLGVSVSTEFYQPVPFFYTREGANLNLIGHYRGGVIFIICNGPSLASGQYDLSLLKKPGVMTYGMNNGARTIRPNFWTCVDDPKRFLKSIWLDPCITKFVPHAHAEKKIFDNEQWKEVEYLVGQCPNVIYYHRNEKFMAERFLFEDTINWGNSGDEGGGRSVFLPILRISFLLGFRTVYLLGADFKMSQNYTYHFDEQRSKGAVNCNMNTYDRLKNDYLPALKPYLDAEGFKVYNCNPESELEVFDHVPYTQAIEHATAHLGDVSNERTWGMYSKPEERQKWINEPEENQKGHLEYIKNRPKTPVYNVTPSVVDQEPLEETQNAFVLPTPAPPSLPQVVPTIIEQVPTPVPMGAKTVGTTGTTQKMAIPPQPPKLPQFRKPQGQVQPQPKPSLIPPPPPPPPMREITTGGGNLKPQPIPQPIPQPREVVATIPKPQAQGESRRIIRSLPCGAISDGSSNNPSWNITIEDDGN